MKKVYILALITLCLLSCAKEPDLTKVYENIARKIQFPTDKVYTITDFSGNYGSRFANDLKNALIKRYAIRFVDYDNTKKVLQETLKYSEPVFDDKYSNTLPNLISPDIIIYGSANRQKSNFLFKQKEHLDFQLTISEMDTGIILYTTTDRFQIRYNPPIILLIIAIVLILAIARWFIYLKKGYNVRYVILSAMLILTIIIVWWLL